MKSILILTASLATFALATPSIAHPGASAGLGASVGVGSNVSMHADANANLSNNDRDRELGDRNHANTRANAHRERCGDRDDRVLASGVHRGCGDGSRHKHRYAIELDPLYADCASCADGKSLAVVADTAHGASSFFFVVAWRDSGYHVSGEGNGDGSAFNAAGHDLEALTSAQIVALIAETRAVRNPSTN
jgi:hypothetical protein